MREFVCLCVLRVCISRYAACKVEPLDSPNVSTDLAAVLGPKLPDFVYFVLAEGTVHSFTDAFVVSMSDGPSRGCGDVQVVSDRAF